MGIKTLQYGIGQAKGLYQGVDDNLLNMAYSPDCQNIDVSEGIISTRNGSHIGVGTYNKFSVVLPQPDANTYNPKLIIFHKPSISGYPIAIYGTHQSGVYKWYAYTARLDAEGDAVYGWNVITAEGGGAILTTTDPEKTTFMQYVISDVMYLIITDGGVLYKLWYDYVEDPDPPFNRDEYIYAAALGGSPPQGYSVTLHRERAWTFAGNALSYSNAYDIEDWSTAGETGEINIVTFDSDSIIGIANWLDDVVVFKNNSMWKVQGDIPSEYSVEQIYSGKGAISQKSIVTDGMNCFFATGDGIYSYDGVGCKPILTKEIADTLGAMLSVKLLIAKNKLYIMDINDNVLETYNGKCLVYDLLDKTISVIKTFDILDADIYDNKIIYTDGDYLYEFNNTYTLAGETFTALKDADTNIAAYWITPESDCKYPAAKKKLREITFAAWGTTSAGASGGQVKITVYYNLNGTQKTKEKTVTLATTRRPHRLLFNVTGRLFKYKIENVSGSAINVAGFTPLYEVDVV
jgi:hypothetical protein